MRVVYFGSGDFAVPCLRWLANSPHEVVAVVSQPDRPAGRGKRLMPTPVSEWAESLELPLHRCGKVNTDEMVQRMRDLQADLGLVAAFGQKLGEPLRNAFTGGMVNVHASLLPRHRGAAPIAYSILSGDLTTGITTFRVGEEIDSGPILVQRQTQISKDETQEELHDRLAGIGCDALDATLKLLSDDLHYPGQVQDESLVTRAPKLKKSDGQLDFNEPARSLWLRCRAMWHWPGARCMYESQHGKQEVVTFSAVTPLPVDAGVAPGTITDTMTVATGQGSLEIHGLKPAGKREMGWKDFINGRQVQPGDRFTSLSTQGGGG